MSAPWITVSFVAVQRRQVGAWAVLRFTGETSDTEDGIKHATGYLLTLPVLGVLVQHRLSEGVPTDSRTVYGVEAHSEIVALPDVQDPNKFIGIYDTKADVPAVLVEDMVEAQREDMLRELVTRGSRRS